MGIHIWLGPSSYDTKIALEFMKNEILQLPDFDELCKDQAANGKWEAVFHFLQHPWFSRRWSVVEIAFAKHVELRCGSETISWGDFADVMHLFMEVETASLRLSEIVKKDPKFYHVPQWFEGVSGLGPSLLVDATNGLDAKRVDAGRSDRIEYLVYRMALFSTVIPHDAIYSLLALAKDTSPVVMPPDSWWQRQMKRPSLCHQTFQKKTLSRGLRTTIH